jgi:ATP-binding protein involved in chromosome partitioning
MPSENDIIAALRRVVDPELGRNVVDLGMVRNISISRNGKVKFTLAFTVSHCPLREQLTRNAEQVVAGVPGVTKVEIIQSEMTPDERKAALGTIQPGTLKPSQFNQIKQVVAVMSGKGGVGKSSVTALLASAMAHHGLSVGILDADVTGPSIPKLFGLPPGGVEGSQMGILPPLTPDGIKVMSVNLLVKDEDDPVVWRGPVITATIKQFWTEVIWSKLDFLLVDLPPGTSDATLTVMQSLPVTGVILVTTPQELATMVVRKATHMLQKLNIPILGLVENMSYFVCPETGTQHNIFGPSHAKEIADLVGISTWTRLQIDPNIATSGDNGRISTVNIKEIDNLVVEMLQPVGAPA